MTVLEVLRDTMARFEKGDDSRSNLSDVISVLNQKYSKALDEQLTDAVTTEHVA